MAEQKKDSPDKPAPVFSPLRHPLLIAVLILIVGAILFLPGRQSGNIDPAIQRTLDRLTAAAAAIDADEARLIELRRAPAESAHSDEAAALEASIRVRREIATQLWLDLGALMELAPPFYDSSHLVRFASQPVQRWNYDQIYHPIEGPQPDKMPAGFSFEFDRVIPQPDGSLLHRLDEHAGAAIKWERELQRARTEGHYLVEATINQIRPGVVYAPLWLYAEGPQEWGHEFDFELVDGHLEYNLHNGQGGYLMRRVEKDLSGHRVRYEIIRRPSHVTMRVTSLTDGWSDELEITPELVAEWAGEPDAPPDLHFPPDHVAMFPVTELWRCHTAEWCGQWQALAPGKFVEMVLHGYRFDP